MNLMEMLAAANGVSDERTDSIEVILNLRIAKLRRMLVITEKALAEVQALGVGKFDRILRMVNDNIDPDVIPSTLKIGPHGPGCECSPDEEDESCSRH